MDAIQDGGQQSQTIASGRQPLHIYFRNKRRETKDEKVEGKHIRREPYPVPALPGAFRLVLAVSHSPHDRIFRQEPLPSLIR